MFRKLVIIATLLSSGSSFAQTLSPAEILSQVDKKLEAQNPYAALLNDPDPERSLAAMEIMLESGDATLKRLATEFGLQSTNPQVNRAAVKAILATGPNLTVQLTPQSAKDDNFKTVVEERLRGSVDTDGVGFVNIEIGEWSEQYSCYLGRGESFCVVTLSAAGYGIRKHPNENMKGIMKLDGEGRLMGAIRLYRVDLPAQGIVRLTL